MAALADRQAFAEIVERYEAAIRRYVRRLGCVDDNDADDVLQETFIKVFINLNDFDPNLKFSSWLYRIAHNETISFLRKKKVRPGVLTLNAEDVHSFFAELADEQDFMELAIQQDEAKLTRNLLSELDQKYQAVLILRFLEEKSYTEIGDILKLPAGTVATLINRGKKELKLAYERTIVK